MNMLLLYDNACNHYLGYDYDSFHIIMKGIFPTVVTRPEIHLEVPELKPPT
jgi:hypothetical protein